MKKFAWLFLFIFLPLTLSIYLILSHTNSAKAQSTPAIQVLGGTFKSRSLNTIRQIMFKSNQVYYRDVSYDPNNFPAYLTSDSAGERHLSSTGQGDIQAFASYPKLHSSDDVRQILVRGGHVYFRDVNYVTNSFPNYQQLAEPNEHLSIGSGPIQAMDGTFKSRTSEDIRQILIKGNHIYFRDVNYSTNSFPPYQQVSEPNEHLNTTGTGDIQAFASYVKSHNSDDVRQILVRGGHVYFRDVNYVTNSFPSYQQLAEPNEYITAGQPPTSTPPSFPPPTLSCTSEPGKITWKWNAVTGATSYHLTVEDWSGGTDYGIGIFNGDVGNVTTYTSNARSPADYGSRYKGRVQSKKTGTTSLVSNQVECVIQQPPCPRGSRGNLNCSADSCVNQADLDLLKQFFGKPNPTNVPQTQFTPNLYQDNATIIDTADYEILRQNFNTCSN